MNDLSSLARANICSNLCHTKTLRFFYRNALEIIDTCIFPSCFCGSVGGNICFNVVLNCVS